MGLTEGGRSMEATVVQGRKEYFRSRQFSGQVGARIRKARKWSDLLICDLARELGVDDEHVRKLEKGVWLPTVGELAALAGLLNCSVDWLLCLSDDQRTREERIAQATAQAELAPVENLATIELDRCEGERREDRYGDPKTQRSRERMCHSKRRFRYEDAAIRGAINASRHYGQGMRPYRCPVCGGWHLTSQELPDFNPKIAV